MTQPGSILGAPPAPLATGPSQEDRLLAAAAYLGYISGLWLVVPIVIYVLRREKSRFVGHHALRAVLLHLVAIPVFLVSYVLAIAVTFGLAASFRDISGHGREAAHMGVALISMIGWSLPWILYLLVCVVGAVRAFQGRLNTRSLVGRLVEWLLCQDRAAAPDTHPGP